MPALRFPLGALLALGGIATACFGPPIAPWAAPSLARAQDARQVDAHADRILLVPTAETQPQGQLFLSSYEIVIPSVGYAFTDRLHGSAIGFTDFDGAALLELHLKASVLRAGRARVAIGSGLNYLRGSDEPEDEREEGAPRDFLAWRAGATFQFCLDDLCRSSLSLATTIFAHAQTDLLLPIGAGGGAIVFVSDEIRVLFELSGLWNAAEDFGLLELPLAVAGFGLRITPSRRVAIDIGLLRSLRQSDELHLAPPQLFDLLGLPFFALTFRFPV